MNTGLGIPGPTCIAVQPTLVIFNMAEWHVGSYLGNGIKIRVRVFGLRRTGRNVKLQGAVARRCPRRIIGRSIR